MKLIFKLRCFLFGRPRVTRLVKRGYITRFSSQLYWAERLIIFYPNEELPDGDAIPYYIDNGDCLVEYYGLHAPKDCYIYRVAEYKSFYQYLKETSPEIFKGWASS